MAAKSSRSIVIHQKRNGSPVIGFQKQLRNPYLLITYIFLLLFICLKLLTIPIPFPQQPPKTAAFQVQGSGDMAAIPNSTNLSFSISKTASTVAEAQNQ